LSIAYPPFAIAYEGFKELLIEVTDTTTRIAAQDSLAKAIISVTPAMGKLSIRVKEQSDLLKLLVVNIANLRVDALKGEYGSAKISYYKKFNAYRNMEKLYGSILIDCTCDKETTPLPKYCSLPNNEKNDGILECHLTREGALTSRLTALERIKDEHAEFMRAVSSEYKWSNSITTQLKATSAAAATWASTHKKVAT